MECVRAVVSASALSGRDRLHDTVQMTSACGVVDRG